MIRNYIKIAWRNLIKGKSFSVLNIAGLAIGMASAILIFLWIENEVSIDRHYPKGERIYQMYNRDKFGGELWVWNSTPKIMAPTLRKDYPEIEDAVRLSGTNFLFTVGDKKLNESGAFVDPSFFTVFDIAMLQGNDSTALNHTYNIALTEEFAQRLFGTKNALGQTVKIDSMDIFTVSAVLKKRPNNSRFQADYYLPWSYMKKLDWDDEWWGNNSVNTYALLKPHASLETFNSKVRTITIDHTKESSQSNTEVFGYPIGQVYLYGKNENGHLVGGRIVTVKMFAAIALSILLIACINFMNLSTARSEKRAKEVGIRKVSGAEKRSIMAQFIAESTLISLIAGTLAILLVQLVMPSFNRLVNKELFLPFREISFWLQWISFILFTGLLAGSYPAFFLSSFNPVKVLKGSFRALNASVNPRKVLVVLQFSFAIILIISTIVIQRQIQHAQKRELGYEKDNLIYIHMQGEIGKHYEALKQSLLSSNAVSAITKSMSPITQRYSDGWGYSWPGSTEEDKKLDFVRFSTDTDFMKVMGTQLVAGRDIDIVKFPSDSSAILLNETAVSKMRLDKPIGQVISNGEEKLTVVGVIKDFIFESPYEPVNPLLVMGPSSWFNVIHVRLNPNLSTSQSLQAIQKTFEQFNPNYPFEYHFVDEEYAKKFDDTKRTARLSMLFTALTILISCLGLFGLSAYMAANRIKEIGVRKVLGASVGSISLLLSKDFLKLVGIAFLIASPIAWYIMHKWLENYTYKIEIEWWVFAATGFISITIAIITVVSQSIRAAMANPINSLKTDN
ncbi:ABC transporter permease [Marinilongibacter aquaticus]|uniref:ABC transporter permease n=1 Tax=Marinilongibacter aquaticus TaxID=2975157 RepID=UPI0021BD3FA2|nr:ABC transporter permease [Marinilongibacter aquaticus]UBM57291.1 ABC transporter permease [Marinilongibacter aquaticus]